MLFEANSAVRRQIAARLTHDDVQHETRSLSKAAYNRYGNHAYSAGYYESMVAELVAAMSDVEQQVWVAQLQKTALDLAK